MIDKVFFQILNMSFASSFAIIFVLFARLILKKVPKVFSYTLWSVVLFRLICPVSFESTFSLLPINVAPVPIATPVATRCRYGYLLVKLFGLLAWLC